MKPRGEKVDTPKKGQQWVIADIHGCYQTFRKLISRLSLNLSDQLFLLGDYINRGSNSEGVLQTIIRMQRDGYQVFPVRGNHEELALSRIQVARLTGKPVRYYEFGSFFESLPYFYETDTAFLVHGGFDFSKQNPFEDFESMPWVREMRVDPTKTQNRPVIHGHTTTSLDLIRLSIENKSLKIPLDNGCVYRSKPELGNLLAMNMKSYELIIQPNVD
ncbi:MAG: metallophosphoesterase [Bacteroidia bacterium]|nr:metallophosphoesterase [Bacteroidia bacterium]